VEAAESFNAMVNDRIRISNRAEVDKELVKWFKQACQEG
jgi:hypothetical protein